MAARPAWWPVDKYWVWSCLLETLGQGLNCVDKHAAGLYWHCVTYYCRCLQAKCKALVKYNNTDGIVLLASLRKLNALGRSCNSQYVIKRPKLVLLYSNMQFHTRRPEGCSLPNEDSAKIVSSNQNCTLWSSFFMELFEGEAVIRKAASLGHGSSLVPQECLCFSSTSLSAGKGWLCVQVYKTLEETGAFVFVSHPSLKMRLTGALVGISNSYFPVEHPPWALAATSCFNSSCLFYQQACQWNCHLPARRSRIKLFFQSYSSCYKFTVDPVLGAVLFSHCQG